MKTERHEARLRVIALFEDLSTAELTRISRSCHIRAYARDVDILTERDFSTDVFFILEGTVRVTNLTSSGKEVILSHLSSGDILGEFSAIDKLPRSASVVALTDCVVAKMSADEFFNILRGNADIAVRLVEFLIAKIRRMSERVFEVSALAVGERVRRELIRLASSGTRLGTSIVIKPAPTHYEIAAQIGSHREAVTRVFNQLEAEGVVEIKRRQIRILDFAHLASKSQEQ